MSGLRGRGAQGTILFDDREALKNMATVERLCRQLVRAGADRRAVLVAVGGGVVGDVAGSPRPAIFGACVWCMFRPPWWGRWIARLAAKRA